MKRTVLLAILYFLLQAGIALTQARCTKKAEHAGASASLSAADKAAGLFTGTGKYLPGGISLGNTLLCTAPPVDYQSKYQRAAATVNITKLTDSTVTLTLLTGPFPLDKYPSLKLVTNGNMISFGNLGYYDSNTKTLAFSGVAPNFSYAYIRSCQPGLPYYYSTGVILYPNPDQIGHFTIKRYEFSGTKE